MSLTLKEKLERFTAIQLIDFYSERYVYEFGEKKLIEVVSKIMDSDKAKNLMSQCYRLGLFPTSKEVTGHINTIPYFLFAKAETLCLGSLTVIGFLEREIENEQHFAKIWGKEHTPLIINIINDCNNLKINRGDSFFSRFYTDVSHYHSLLKS